MLTFLTPFSTSWALPVKSAETPLHPVSFVKREFEALFFVIWAAIAAGAAGRVIATLVVKEEVVPWMTAFAVAGASLGFYAIE